MYGRSAPRDLNALLRRFARVAACTVARICWRSETPMRPAAEHSGMSERTDQLTAEASSDDDVRRDGGERSSSNRGFDGGGFDDDLLGGSDAESGSTADADDESRLAGYFSPKMFLG